MSKGLNRVRLIGRLERDPEMRYTRQGTPVATFSLATPRKGRDRNGNERDFTDWHRIAAADRLAEICQPLKKGRQVYIEGRLKTRRWTDRSGKEQFTTEIIANNVIVVDERSGGSISSMPTAPDIEYSDEDFQGLISGRSQHLSPADMDNNGDDYRSNTGSTNAQPRQRNQVQPIKGDDDSIPF